MLDIMLLIKLYRVVQRHLQLSILDLNAHSSLKEEVHDIGKSVVAYNMKVGQAEWSLVCS